MPSEIHAGGQVSAFMFMPDGVRFETQEPGETVILLLRRHWFTNLSWVMTGVLLVLFPLFLFPYILLNNFFGYVPPPAYITTGILGWYLLAFSFVLVNFLLWYFTVSIVTDERIIDIDFINILNKKFAETRIARVEDVTQRSGGFWMTFFDFGDVFVQTAAREQVFQFHAVPHPERVVRIINQLMGKEEEGGEFKA